MRKLITVVLVLWSIILTLWTINQCSVSKTYERDKEIPDTIYLPIIKYKYLEPFKTVDLPQRVIFYGNTSDETATVNPVEDSLSSFNINQGNLRLDFINTRTENPLTKVYNLNLDKNQYTFTNGTLTHKKLRFYERKDFIKPYIYLEYRPLNKLWDTGIGLNFKTGGFNYQMGINSFYYPSLNKRGFDLEVKIQYNF